MVEGEHMKYAEYKETKQNEFNALPIFFAFSNKQFEDALTKRGLTLKEAAANVYRLGYGGYFLKKDAPVVEAYFSQDNDKELRELMEADSNFCLEAFEYEMLNHEYPINWQGDWEVCSCFGTVEYSDDKYGDDYLRELGFSDKVIKLYHKAARKVQDSCDW